MFTPANRSLVAFLFCCLSRAVTAAEAESSTGPADALVQQALAAELQGDSTQRAALLAEALKLDPNHAAARWQSGQIRVGDQWLAVESAEDKTSEAGIIAEYRRLREQTPPTEAGHIAAARWCRKNDLPEQEKLHWHAVLMFNSKNADARSRLALRENAGRLMTEQQIKSEKEWRKEQEHSRKYWEGWVKERRLAIAGEDHAARDQALADIAAINEPAAIPFLEAALSTQSESGALAVVQALAKLRPQAATDSLVRHAVLCDHNQVRAAATQALKSRPLHSFVPVLLANLKSPLEFTQITRATDNSMSRAFVFEREEQFGISRNVQSLDKIIQVTGQPSLERYFVEERVRQSMWLDATVEWARGAGIKTQVEKLNQLAEALNKRIISVLSTCTEQSLGDEATKWWKWWETYNETANDLYKPTNISGNSERYQRSIHVYTPPPMYGGSSGSGTSGPGYTPYTWSNNAGGPSGGASAGGVSGGASAGGPPHSCFLRGTLVTTETGMTPIEKICVGDRVLAQNSESGELAYRVVINTTVRPPRPTKQIVLDDETIVATLGHPFWVAGSGWRLARDLKPGDILHGLHGGVKVTAVENGAEAEVYNLVVADFNTYFVGKNRVLVHDNRPLVVTDSVVPGLVMRK